MNTDIAGRACVVTLMLGFLIGLILGGFLRNSYWKEDAIKHNAAHYDQRTGEWKWNEKETK